MRESPILEKVVRQKGLGKIPHNEVIFVWFPAELEQCHRGLRHKVHLDREFFMRKQNIPAHSVELVEQNSVSHVSSPKLLRQRS